MYKEIINNCLEKVYTNGISFNGKFPGCKLNFDGTYDLYDGGQWIDGFWVGNFYLAYAYTNNIKYLEIADKYQDFFRKRIINDDRTNEENNFMALDHDVGFIFSITQVARYKLTGDEKAREIGLKAADVLANRFNESGNFIVAWNDWPGDTEAFKKEKRGKVIIDSMMNIPLLFWAFEQTKVQKYYDIAVSHARTIARYIIRDDFSTFHTYNFNPETGEPVCGKTFQGYSDNSCWSRGQAWAIYGFVLAYQYTRLDEFKEIAKGLIDYFYRHLDKSNLPRWDFATNNLNFSPWDSSAAAVAVAGIAVFSLICDECEKNYYEDLANKILTALINYCSTKNAEEMQSLLLHGTVGSAYRYGNEKQIVIDVIDQSLVYGDYFYLEALMIMERKNPSTFWI